MNNIKVPLIGMGLIEFVSLIVFLVLAVWVWQHVAKLTGG